MNKIKYLLLFSLLFFVACEDDSTNTGDNLQGITSISGKLENWTYGTGKTIKLGTYLGQNNFYVTGSGDIAADGSFSIALLTPSAEWLNNLVDSTAHFTSTTAGVKVYGQGGAMLFDGQNIFGFAIYINRDFTSDTFWIPQVGDKVMQPTYFTAATTINGSETSQEDWDPNHRDTTYVTRVVENKAVAAGWNKIYGSITSKTVNTYTINMSTAEPTGMKWYFSRIN